jgi:hypothetical protein
MVMTRMTADVKKDMKMMLLFHNNNFMTLGKTVNHLLNLFNCFTKMNTMRLQNASSWIT